MLHIGEKVFVVLERRPSTQYQQRKTVFLPLVTLQLCICVFYAVKAPSIIKPLLINPVYALHFPIMPGCRDPDPHMRYPRLLAVSFKY